MNLRVLTVNIFGHHGAWPSRKNVLREDLRTLEPDIIAFQEVIVRDGYDQLAELLPGDYHVHHQGGRSDDGCGASIASRFPVGTIR